MPFFRKNLHKFNGINCYGECGRVQVTENIAVHLGIEHGSWEFKAALQTIAMEKLGADAIIRARGGERHHRMCPDCRNALLTAAGNSLTSE